MKSNILSLVLLTAFAFSSCQKDNDVVKSDDKEKKEEMSVCSWDESKLSDPAQWKKYVVKPLVTSADCGGCIVSGVVKFVSVDKKKPTFMVDYGDGTCDAWAILVTYYNADDKSGKDEKGSKDEKVKKCKIKLDCNPKGGQ